MTKISGMNRRKNYITTVQKLAFNLILKWIENKEIKHNGILGIELY